MKANHQEPQAEPQSEHARIEQQVQKWVAQTFFGTLMKQMRNSPFKSEMFDGGRGGQAFSELYDQRLVEHMSKASGKKLVGRIVRDIEAKKAYANQPKTKPKFQEWHDANDADNQQVSAPSNEVRIHVPPAR